MRLFLFFIKMGDKKYKGGAEAFQERFFWMITTGADQPSMKVLKELKADGLLSEVSDQYTIHFTKKGVAKFRRTKM